MADERDPKVTQAYRDLGGEEPSRELDQAILSAAHRQLDKPHAPLVAPAGRHRWYFAFGAAAILVLAVAVTVQVERQSPDPEAAMAFRIPTSPRKEDFYSKEERPAPSEESKVGQRAADASESSQRQEASGKAPSAPRAEAKQPERSESPQMAENMMERRMAEHPAAKPAPSVRAAVEPKPAPFPQAGPLPQAETSAQASAAPPAPQASVSVARPAAKPEARKREGVAAFGMSAASTPEQFLEQIAELRRQGRHEEADKALAEFRQRYPDYALSDEMRAKVERKK